MTRMIVLALGLAASAGASAYCVHNQLGDRPISVAQEHHPDPLRSDRRFQATLKPGQSRCCKFHDLDCNPGGRQNSVVNLAIVIGGAPEYWCGFPEGAEPFVKVTGGGTVRVLPNRRAKSASPYVVRVRTHDGQNLTGPRGLDCPAARMKGK